MLVRFGINLPAIFLPKLRIVNSSQGARASYQFLEDILRYANKEYRLRNPDDVCSLYESIIAIEKGKEQSQISPILCAQYSRFLYMVFGKGKGGKEGPDNSSAACFIETEELSSIFLEVTIFSISLWGCTVHQKSNVRHLKLFLQQKSSSESKKRHQESYSASYRTKVEKNGSQDHCAAGYGVQTQATQAQGQQWPLCHTQQQAVPQQVYAQSIVAATMPPAQQSAAVAHPWGGGNY
ncbi:hypothetical protein Tco_1066846 [Tanacetum coccineum]|uniref:Uncharacterized protein n=1 Tax=Tanacetum coccineum TaxID=301880 RepID=A0ABQ5HC21_9ASTR